jgi:GAF domain-containing protein
MSSSQSPSNSAAPRRASVQSPSSLFTCVVSSCSLPAIRRGGYCIPHQNQFAVTTFGVTSVNDKDKPISNEQVCFGHACQGQIRFGFCSRHRLLSEELENQLQAQLQIQSNPPVAPASPSQIAVASPVPSGSASEQEFLKLFLSGLHAIYSAIEPHLAAEAIIRETCRILSAERATLFYVDGDELILMIARGVRNIRLPRSKGVAGYVSTAGVTVNIPDAYKEAKFDSSFDTQTGFRTRNIIATPVFDQEGKVIAVLQVINKYQRGAKSSSAEQSAAPRGSLDENSIAADFTSNDQVALEALAFHVSVSLRNAQQFESSKRAETKVSSILEVISMLHSDQDPSMNSIIFTLTTRSPQLVDCDRCTLYLVDYTRDQLVVMTGDVDIRIPLSKGIAGACATSNLIINIPDCYQDSRFNTEIDKKTGYRTKSMLCVPIPGAKGQGESTQPVIGVLQLINRNDEQPFSTEDEQMLSTLLKIAGPILQKYSQFNSAKAIKSAKANAVNEPALAFKPKAKSPIGSGPAPSSLKFKPSLGGNIREGPE